MLQLLQMQIPQLEHQRALTGVGNSFSFLCSTTENAFNCSYAQGFIHWTFQHRREPALLIFEALSGREPPSIVARRRTVATHRAPTANRDATPKQCRVSGVS